MTDIFSVEGVNAYIRALFDTDPPLQDLWVQGEVSNMKAAASGHWYFTIKDSKSALKCVMFRNNASQQIIEPHDGEEIRVHGRVSVYEQRGEYQLYADEVQPAGGIGNLYQRFEALKAQLQAEGLFEQSHKQALPIFPLRIGVVTSPDAAAFQDVQNVLKRRFPLADIILSPTLVQGYEAPPLIVRALNNLNKYQACDVILLVRGGGSIEDLWAFNDEAVARAIVASQIPVISGVGHETDFTIADFVSDYRAPTPSAAAEVATPQIDDFRQDLARKQSQIIRLTNEHITERRADIALMHGQLQSASPVRYIQDMRQRIDELSERIDTHNQRKLALLHERLLARRKALDNAHPDTLLKRGYAIVTQSDDGTAVTSIKGIKTGTGITIKLQDGELTARIEDKDTHGQYKRTLI
ncbi:MAG: exodeoxyribonuclease VII large subunit [Phototrophicaceae bacterium]